MELIMITSGRGPSHPIAMESQAETQKRRRHGIPGFFEPPK
jgi:hypothetical protein